MARLILTLLAALAFAAGPANASAARTGCAGAMAQPMTAMEPAAHTATDPAQTTTSPCCNHASKACAKACATMCVPGAVVPVSFEGAAIFTTLASANPATNLFSPSRAPDRFDPPPK